MSYELDFVGEVLDDDDDDDGGYSAYCDDHEDWESMCFCGEHGVDECQCCGQPLCVMHSETGAGFCKDCPTEDWMEEQRRVYQDGMDALWPETHAGWLVACYHLCVFCSG